MKHEVARKKIIDATIRQIRKFAQDYLPASPLKTFLTDEKNIYLVQYLDIISVKQIAELEISLFADIDEQTFDHIAEHMALVNACLAFETISDDLAAGTIGSIDEMDNTAEMQLDVLNEFNNRMIDKLNGDSRRAEVLLSLNELTRKKMEKLSSFEQSLSPSTIRRPFELYCQNINPTLALNDLGRSIFPILILNIETFYAALQAIEGHAIHELLKEKLIARYQAVNRLFANTDGSLPRDDLLELGADTILVTAASAYFIGILEKYSPIPQLQSVIKSGSLAATLDGAAKLVRLLNDLGAKPLQLTPEQLDRFSAEIKSYYNSASFQGKTFSKFLSHVCEQPRYKNLLSRLYKDNSLREANVLLDRENLRNMTDIPGAIDKLIDFIKDYSRIYNDLRENLLESLHTLGKHLQDKKIVSLIYRWVVFHERLYSKDFKTTRGDYGVPAPEDAAPKLAAFLCQFNLPEGKIPTKIKKFKLDAQNFLSTNYKFECRRHNEKIEVQVSLDQDRAKPPTDITQKVMQKFKNLLAGAFGEFGIKGMTIEKDKLIIKTVSAEKSTAVENFLNAAHFSFHKTEESSQAGAVPALQ